MKKTIFDVEVCPNRAMVGFKDITTGEIKQFEHNEGDSIREYIKDRILIGFNSKNYDNLIVTAMMNGRSIKRIYEISMDLIDGEGMRWDYDNEIENDIDIMEVAPGQASLKLYASRLQVKKLQDLPYSPHEKHSKKMWKNVCNYNKNDLNITELLYNHLIPQLEIRKDIGKRYGIDVMSRSDAQVAEDVFKATINYDKKQRTQIPEYVTYKAPEYVEFKTKQLQQLKEKFESCKYYMNRKTGKFLPQEWLKEKVVIDGMPYTIGYGGLHSNEKSVSYTTGLKNADISSMYPSLIINSGKYPLKLGEEWLVNYTKFRDTRLEIKHTDKELSAVLKIFLNGSYGKLNSHYSVLYAPHLLLDTTITGQLSLLMVIEALVEAGIKVVSANTDGVEYLHDGTDRGERIIDELGKKMNLLWEHAEYKALYARDVNSYIAVYDGYTKSKGFYGEVELDKNVEYPIVTEAIRKFLLDGTPMENTIRGCTDPSQFCSARTVAGGAVWSPEEYPNTDEYDKYINKVPFKRNKALEKRNDEYKKQFILAEADKWYIGKVVRFYYAKDGKPMFYKGSGNRVPKSDGCRPMMKLKKKIPKDIDYDKYIKLANTHLKELGYEQ